MAGDQGQYHNSFDEGPLVVSYDGQLGEYLNWLHGQNSICAYCQSHPKHVYSEVSTPMLLSGKCADDRAYSWIKLDSLSSERA